jgi:RimJ/RimL family protein N-acetyltransferase
MHTRVVVDTGGTIAGFFAVSIFDGWLAEIHGLVVARTRSGAGRWALREAMRWAFDEAGRNTKISLTTAS